MTGKRRAAIFSPHLHVGGMEKFAILTARALADEGWSVDLLTDRTLAPRRLERAFGASLKGFRLRVLGPAYTVRLAPMTARYDLFINNSAAHDFPSFARESWLWAHFLPKRVPRHLGGYRVLANSRYTAGLIRRFWSRKAEVLYGPVAVGSFRPLAKEKIILSCGRLDSAISKNIPRMARLFARLRARSELAGWSYHIAGVVNGPGRGAAARLEAAAGAAPVFVHLNPSFDELRRLYGRASIFWSGTGAMPAQRPRPGLMEHFGIALVEAMAAGGAPFAYDGGGPREIIRDGETGFLYRNWDELAEKTIRAAASWRALAARGRRARAAAERFGWGRFRSDLRKLLRRRD